MVLAHGRRLVDSNCHNGEITRLWSKQGLWPRHSGTQDRLALLMSLLTVQVGILLSTWPGVSQTTALQQGCMCFLALLLWVSRLPAEGQFLPAICFGVAESQQCLHILKLLGEKKEHVSIAWKLNQVYIWELIHDIFLEHLLSRCFGGICTIMAAARGCDKDQEAYRAEDNYHLLFIQSLWILPSSFSMNVDGQQFSPLVQGFGRHTQRAWFNFMLCF